MKDLLTVLIVTLMCGLCYYLGGLHRKSTDYEAACLFKDFINWERDQDPEIQKDWKEWTKNFQDYKFQFLKEKDLEEYCWCY